MIGAAASDLHLGYRAFAKRENGRNARELDVERAWEAVCEGMADAQPDLITFAGDIFHNPRPPMRALIAWREGIKWLLDNTEAAIVAILGNHDAPRTAESITPVVIPDDLDPQRFRVVTAPGRVRFDTCPIGSRPGESVAVACFPFVPLSSEKSYRLAPDAAADINVLLVHAAVVGDPEGDRLPHFYAAGNALDISRRVAEGKAEVDRWDVVACGDFHEFRRLHPTALAFYSGAIERTTTNIWAEEEAKGFVLYDTDRGWLEHATHETRSVTSMRFQPNIGDAYEVETLNANLGRAIENQKPEAGEPLVVRWVVDDFPRSSRELIDWAAVRELKARCLHFELDLRWASGGEAIPQHEKPGAQTLTARADDFFRDDLPEVRSCALGYLGTIDPKRLTAIEGQQRDVKISARTGASTDPGPSAPVSEEGAK